MTDESTNSVTEVPITEFAKLQFQQALDTIRAMNTLQVQIITVLAVANATLLGYSINARMAGMLFVGSIFPAMVLYVIYAVRRVMLPLFYVALSLEERYRSNTMDGLVGALLTATVSPKYVAELKSISASPNQADRMLRLRRSSGPLIGSGKRIGRTTLVVVAVGQIIAALVLSSYYGWRLF